MASTHRDHSPISQNLINERNRLTRPGKLRYSNQQWKAYRSPAPHREAIKDIDKRLVERHYARSSKNQEEPERSRSTSKKPTTNRTGSIGNRMPILDPKTTTGYKCSEFIKIKHIIDKPEHRNKEATDSIKQMEGKFV